MRCAEGGTTLFYLWSISTTPFVSSTNNDSLVDIERKQQQRNSKETKPKERKRTKNPPSTGEPRRGLAFLPCPFARSCPYPRRSPIPGRGSVFWLERLRRVMEWNIDPYIFTITISGIKRFSSSISIFQPRSESIGSGSYFLAYRNEFFAGTEDVEAGDKRRFCCYWVFCVWSFCTHFLCVYCCCLDLAPYGFSSFQPRRSNLCCYRKTRAGVFVCSDHRALRERSGRNAPMRAKPPVPKTRRRCLQTWTEMC